MNRTPTKIPIMKYDSNIHHRRSIRLKEYDYSWTGWYYITICVKDRECSLGKTRNDGVVLSDVGKIAEKCWKEIPHHFHGVDLDAYIIMPNHLHGIVIINNPSRRGVQLNAPTEDVPRLSPRKGSLSIIVRTFKAAVTTKCRRSSIAGFSWQRGFYEHVIRNDGDLHRIRTYIQNNPLKWSMDEENPNNRP